MKEIKNRDNAFSYILKDNKENDSKWVVKGYDLFYLNERAKASYQNKASSPNQKFRLLMEELERNEYIKGLNTYSSASRSELCEIICKYYFKHYDNMPLWSSMRKILYKLGKYSIKEYCNETFRYWIYEPDQQSYS